MFWLSYSSVPNSFLTHFSDRQGFADLESSYDILKQLGEGAYGVVVAAKDKSTQAKVAIKKIKDAVEDKEQGKLLLRELRLLRHFRGHENIVCIKDIIETPKGQSKFKDIFIITDLMDTDLHRIIRSSQSLSDDHVRYFTYQILRGLKYIHSANVMHRDLKPNNLLVNSNCDLKICDLVRISARRGQRACEHMDSFAYWNHSPFP
jgi:serine/threonine protein kinase